MRVEFLKFTRCCCCIPLRYGLLVTGYLKLIFSIFSLILLIVNDILYVQNTVSSIALLSFFLAVLLTDTALSVLFIVGCHKKSAKLLRIYKYYGIGTVVISAVALIGLVIYGFIQLTPYAGFMYSAMLLRSDMATGIISICFQLYVILLTRSEIIKLENNCKFRFSNIATEAECTLDGVDVVNGSYTKNVEPIQQNDGNEDIDDVEQTHEKFKGNYAKLVN